MPRSFLHLSRPFQACKTFLRDAGERPRTLARGAGAAARRTLAAALGLLAPDFCRSCGRASDGASGFCAACLRGLRWLDAACGRCACPLGAPLGPGAASVTATHRALPLPANGAAPCDACNRRQLSFDSAAAAGLHAGPLRLAILRYRFQGDRGVLPLLCEALVRASSSPAVAAAIGEAGAVVPVPLHPWRRWFRGRDPTAELACELAALVDLPCLALLRKTRWTPSQVGLPRPARIDNLRGAFRLRRGGSVPPVVVLFDDVLTTGTTASRCAHVLKRGGARVVAVVALARS